jgi:predicted DNA-binding protein with PD1-like motif
MEASSPSEEQVALTPRPIELSTFEELSPGCSNWCAEATRRVEHMRHKLLHQSGDQRTYAVVLRTGDEVMACLKRFIADEGISAAQLTAIGALSDVVLLYFDWDKKDYVRIPVEDQVEVASLIGDIAEDPSGRPALHVHLVVGKRDGTAMAGHLGEAHVRPTLEVIVTESPAHLRKKKDPESGLALIQL